MDAGTVKVVGVYENDIYQEARLLLDNEQEYMKMANAVNPYGDGHASERIVEVLYRWKKEDEYSKKNNEK